MKFDRNNRSLYLPQQINIHNKFKVEDHIYIIEDFDIGNQSIYSGSNKLINFQDNITKFYRPIVANNILIPYLIEFSLEVDDIEFEKY